MNEKEYTVIVSRLELCDLLLSCTHIMCEAQAEMSSPECSDYRKNVVLPGTIDKWHALHNKLEMQLRILDVLHET